MLRKAAPARNPIPGPNMDIAMKAPVDEENVSGAEAEVGAKLKQNGGCVG